MKKAVLADRTAKLLVMHYDLTAWCVRNVMRVPHLAFSLSVVECRAPLPATARRAGWIGCNVLLGQIPQPAPIPIVTNGEFQSRGKIREAYKRLRPLEKLQIEKPGRTLAVLNVVRSLGIEFKLPELYAHSEELAKLHPENHHVDEKTRQQLQELRDMGIFKFVEPGFYRLL
jgi:type II restriction enzyme